MALTGDLLPRGEVRQGGGKHVVALAAEIDLAVADARLS